MWNIFFALCLNGVIISAVTNNSVWCIIFNIAMYICIAGVIITHEKQKEKIKTLEEKVKQLEKLVGEYK